MTSRMTILTAEEIRAAGGVAQAMAARQRAGTARERRGLDRAGQLDGANEAQVMAEVVAELTRSGFSPPPAGGKRGFFIRVGQHRADLAGSDPGAPDVLVLWHGLPMMFGLEAKARTRGARLSDAQAALHREGHITVVRCAQDVADFILRVESAFPVESRGQIMAALSRKETA